MAYWLTTPRCLPNCRSAHETAQFAKAMAAIPFSLPLLSGADDSFVAQTFCKSDHFIGIIPAILMQVLSVPAVRVRDSSIPASFNRHIQVASSAGKYQRAISRDSFSMYYTILFFTTQLNDSADFRRVFNKVCQQSTKDGKRDIPTGECPACPSFSFGSENAEARYSKSFKQIADCAKHGAKAIANEQIRSRIVTGGALID